MFTRKRPTAPPTPEQQLATLRQQAEQDRITALRMCNADKLWIADYSVGR